MGAFKPLLPFGESTVIESCIINLRSAGIEEIIIVIGHRADDVRKQLKHYDLAFAINPDPDSEMSASIACGVELANPQAEAILIALVDQPAVSDEIIRQLIDGWRRTRARIIQPEHNGRGGHPVLIDLVYRNELLTLDPERGLRALFDAHRKELRTTWTRGKITQVCIRRFSGSRRQKRDPFSAYFCRFQRERRGYHLSARHIGPDDS